jgi:hypothetical protein
MTVECPWCHTTDGCDCQERIDCALAGTFGHISMWLVRTPQGPSVSLPLRSRTLQSDTGRGEHA